MLRRRKKNGKKKKFSRPVYQSAEYGRIRRYLVREEPFLAACTARNTTGSPEIPRAWSIFFTSYSTCLTADALKTRAMLPDSGMRNKRLDKKIRVNLVPRACVTLIQRSGQRKLFSPWSVTVNAKRTKHGY